jgi:hypothetical protein
MMVAGLVRLKGAESPPVEIRRCMAVISGDSCELGIVAAVCFDCHMENVFAVLLGRLPVLADYRLIPVTLINHVSEDAVHLRITAESVEELAQHETG